MSQIYNKTYTDMLHYPSQDSLHKSGLYGDPTHPEQTKAYRQVRPSDTNESLVNKLVDKLADRPLNNPLNNPSSNGCSSCKRWV